MLTQTFSRGSTTYKSERRYRIILILNEIIIPAKKEKNNLPLCVTPWLFDISLQMCRERKRKNHKRKSINERGENTNQINQHIKSARDLIFFFFFFFYPINQRLIIFLKPHAITKEKRDKFARYLCFV